MKYGKTQAQALSIAAHLMMDGSSVLICSTAKQGEDMWARIEAILTPYGTVKKLKQWRKNFAYEVPKK